MSTLITIVGVVALAAVTLVIVLGLKLERPWLQPIALARALVQLAVLSLILNGVITHLWLVLIFLVVMVSAALNVVFRRLKLRLSLLPRVAATVIVASAVPVLIIFGIGAVQPTPQYLLAVGGIVIGNTMTVCTLMGRSLSAAYLSQRDEMEAWLSLGATPRRSALRAVRSAASTALIPATDQTRTTGIVTLPGAFVGAIFAGASPLAAAEFQLVVLAAILAAGALTVAGFTWIFGAPRLLPLDERALGA